ncbi:hypothetical protein PGT21_031063 [Puccinia graminis f. sp. tritici]|uniref:Hydrophobin n=1 Tax=Puccinia graminis f. sp. tritici TaxID=56615 RepID=A0A5B0QUC4_PUCGR|nr:hypothetical protein PGT21_031063 [Puccinia graminis f. sp. tritici]KAA1116809.1 hypothetical protein PGTUg99_021651 [Puccinia graminis f. sp. tritici]
MNVFRSTLLIVFLAGVCTFASARCGAGDVDACATYDHRMYKASPSNPDCHVTSSEVHFCCPANQMVPGTPYYPTVYAIRIMGCYLNQY